MSSKRRKNTNPFAYVDGLNNREQVPFAPLSDTQALSPTFQRLSDNAKYTLMICKLCRQYHTGKDKEGKSRMIQGNPLNFYFNRALYKRYGLKNPNKVHKALAELVSNGFIDVVENNANARKKNVYRFDSKYQRLDNGEQIELSAGARTFLQGKDKGNNRDDV